MSNSAQFLSGFFNDLRSLQDQGPLTKKQDNKARREFRAELKGLQDSGNLTKKQARQLRGQFKEQRNSPTLTRDSFEERLVNTPATAPETSTGNVTKPDMGGGKGGGMPQSKEDAALASDFAAIDNLDIPKEQRNDLKFSKAQERFGPSFNRGDFNFLLEKLTGSKIRQNRDAQAQERQNIYARGLSSMFANF